MAFVWSITNCVCPEPPPPPPSPEWVISACECCEIPRPEPEPAPIRSIPKIDKKFYRIAQSKCDIEANKKFGNAYYQQVKQIRYGIEVPCPVDYYKLYIKKRLSDFAMIYDPTLCVPPVAPVVVEEICVYPIPVPCLPPSNVIVTPDYEECNPATRLTVTTNYN